MLGEPRDLPYSAAAQARAARIEDELLAAIYAAPDDDEPRFVYMDWLLQRDDPRGELMSLQLARRQGPLTRWQAWRERELIASNKELLLGALAPVVERASFERGFPERVNVFRRVNAIGSVVGSPAWATVRSIRIDYFLHLSEGGLLDAFYALLTHPTLSSLRELVSIPVWQASGLVDRGLAPVERLVLSLHNDTPAHILALVRRMPALRSLGLHGAGWEVAEAWLDGAISHVRRLEVEQRWSNGGLVALQLRQTPSGVDGSLAVASPEMDQGNLLSLLDRHLRRAPLQAVQEVDLRELNAGRPLAPANERAFSAVLAQMPNLKRIRWGGNDAS